MGYFIFLIYVLVKNRGNQLGQGYGIIEIYLVCIIDICIIFKRIYNIFIFFIMSDKVFIFKVIIQFKIVCIRVEEVGKVRGSSGFRDVIVLVEKCCSFRFREFGDGLVRL